MAPGRPIFFMPFNVIPVSLNNKLHVNPMETFSQIDAKLTFGPIWGQKGPRNMTLGADILQTSQYSSSELKLVSCVSHWKLLAKQTKN